MNPFSDLRLLMVLLSLWLCSAPPAWSKSSPEPKGPCPDATKEFHLHAGQQYETQKAFEKAGKEYVAAGESPCASIRQEALEGLRRIPANADDELQLGLFYESQGLWTEADSHFSKAAEGTEPPAVRRAAFDGLWRVHNAQNRRVHRTMDYTDFLSAVAGRVVAAIAVVWIVIVLVATIVGNRRALVVHPFDGEKETAEQVSVAFPAIRSRVSSVFGTVMLPKAVKTVYPFVSPRLGELVPQETFEVGGLKVQNLSYIVRLFARPRFEIYGGVLKGEAQDSHFVYAHVWRRWMWLSSRIIAVPHGWGPMQGRFGSPMPRAAL
jgi:hypothetical protein